MRILLLTVAISFCLASNAARYLHPDGSFAFDYDEKQWTLVEEKSKTPQKEAVDQEMKEKTLVTVQRNVADEKYHARFSVVQDSLAKFPEKEGGPKTLLAYQKHATEFLKAQRFENLQTESRKLPRVDSLGVEIKATHRDFGFAYQQVILIRNGFAYLLTAAARKEKMDQYKPDLTRIFDSFEFLPTKK